MSGLFLQRKLCTATVRVSHILITIVFISVFATHTIINYTREPLAVPTKLVQDEEEHSFTKKIILTKQLYERGHFYDPVTFTKICDENGASLSLLILVTSAPSRHDHRMAIRQTWGHFGTRRDIGIGFLLGDSRDPATEARLSAEGLLYGDLIRGNFVDAYTNLTLKTLSMLEWTGQHCPGVKYLLKTDDDVFVNVPRLLNFIGAHSGAERTIYGRLAEKWAPIRDKDSKYYISRAEFSLAVYPKFTTGPAYLLTTDIVEKLFSRALEMRFFKMEDVFLTGIVAQHLKINRVGDKEFFNQRISITSSSRCRVKSLISVHDLVPAELFELWKESLGSGSCK